MMTIAFLMMQFIISAKAGLVNAVEGTSNVHLSQQVAAGAPIQTGPAGRVEVLLNPGTYLRLDENSEAVLDSVELTDIQLHIVSGSAIIDCTAVEKDAPIRVTDGSDTLVISKPGTYRFPEDATPAAGLEEWNRERSDEIAAVAARSAATNQATNNPAFVPSTGGTLYPGGSWPYALPLAAGSAFGPFAFFNSYGYGGGYGYYRPLIPMPPIVVYSPTVIRRPLPTPIAISPRPGTGRPSVPGPRPAPGPSRIGNARASRGGGRR
jgi:hypothetical protein